MRGQDRKCRDSADDTARDTGEYTPGEGKERYVFEQVSLSRGLKQWMGKKSTGPTYFDPPRNFNVKFFRNEKSAFEDYNNKV